MYPGKGSLYIIMMTGFLVVSCGSKPQQVTEETPKEILVSDPSMMNLAELNAAITKDPQNPDNFYYRGLYYATGGDFTPAIEDFTQAVLLDSTFASAFHDRGICKFELMDFEGAIRDYSAAIKIEPEVPEYFYNRGWAYSKTDKIEEAIKDYSQSILLNPAFADAYFRRGYTLMAKDKKAGCADFKKAADLGFEKARIEFETNCP